MSRLVATRLRFDLPLGAPVGTAAKRLDRRAGLVLRLEDGRGHEGFGEASPLPGYSDDTLEAAAAELRALAHASPLEPCDTPGAVAARVADAGLETASARCALESALLDLGARRAGVPLHAWLADAPRTRVPVNALVPLECADAALEAARAALARGVRALKVKVGAPGAFERECRVLGLLRRELGNAVELRVDANGAWSLDEAPARLEALVSAAPAFVEQPVPPRALASLRDSPLPLAADESTRHPDVLDACLDAGPVRVLVLKPMVLGGLLPCLALARRAADAGLRCVVTHLFSGPVAHAGAVELALALGEEPLACGLAPHPVVYAMGLPPQIAHDEGAAHATALPGLGVGAAPAGGRPS